MSDSLNSTYIGSSKAISLRGLNEARSQRSGPRTQSEDAGSVTGIARDHPSARLSHESLENRLSLYKDIMFGTLIPQLSYMVVTN